MASELPEQLQIWIAAAFKTNPQYHCISPEQTELYVQSTSEFFNEIVADHLVVRRAQVGFDALEHSDWVYPALCVRAGVQTHPEGIAPLNSWMLKSPLDWVPTFSQIIEECEWRREVVEVCSSSPTTPISVEQLQEELVVKTCEQVVDFVKILAVWVEAGRPREQQDCLIKMDRKRVKKILEQQIINKERAKEKLDIFKKYFAPDFLIEQLEGSYMKESAICEQLSESMRHC